MFPIAAIPFDEYDALDIADGPRWLLVRLARYADRDGLCFPSIRTLAAAARKSPATICRWLKKLFEEGCFTRTREAGRVYRYTLADRFRLRWRDAPKPAAPEGVSSPSRGVSPTVKQGVSHGATQEVKPLKDEESAREAFKWRAYVRQFVECGERWPPGVGPRPNEPGCLAPLNVLAAFGIGIGRPIPASTSPSRRIGG
jgi:hypothetical protein